MSEPIYQVPRKGEGSYRYMKYPPQQQRLQLLYPGRFMTSEMNFTRTDIPNENPEGLRLTKDIDDALTKAAKIESEAFSRHLGGHGNVLRHPAVAPESPIENPYQSGVSIQDAPDPNLTLENTPFNLNEADKVVNSIEKEVRSSELNLPLVKEGFRRDLNRNIGSNSNSSLFGILTIILLIVIICMLVCITLKS